MELIFNPLVNFGEVWRAQLAKFTLLTSMMVPWELFRYFKVCSDAKERVRCGKQREAIAPVQSLVKTAVLVPAHAVKDLPYGKTF